MHIPLCHSLRSVFLAGMALALSCSDTSPLGADAGTCDCPASEPPIAGRIMTVTGTQIIPAGDRGGQGVACPQGTQRLVGSCMTDDIATIRNVTLEQSGFRVGDRHGWACYFKNNELNPVTIRVSIDCLVPPT